MVSVILLYTSPRIDDLFTTSDAHYYYLALLQFHSSKTLAARSGSQVDSILEIEDAQNEKDG